MTDLINFNQMGIVEPDKRLKQLVLSGSNISVDPNQNILRYFRSGNELYRMAKVYMNEGNFENAYILFLRFLTLFVEKIREHPNLKEVPAETKRANKEKMAEIMALTEKLKTKLLDRYKKEYEQFLKDQEIERRKAIEEAKRKELEDAKNNTAKISTPSNIVVQLPTAPDFADLDEIVYPNDFPSEPQKKPGLLPGSKPPSFDRSTKPSMSVSLMEGALRTLYVPNDTMQQFLDVARPNTARNVETCGILCGKLEQHQLYVTHIILPKQNGTSDSCNTMNEEEIFDIQDQLHLITLGWIHTHPSQTAFLSSVDLHTQCGYQIMLAESIAIVCAPKYNEIGFYSLTSSGLEFIAKCNQTGFHPHPQDQFMEAVHYELDKSKKVTIVDLRQR
ncbi:STAM-binding protein-like A [Chironomus tepperi]|uniref:STAM-binding protein-like A n=1 Tax=Chironomus tepperi TaxID=113505 RepID=UPI00391EE70F